MPTWHLIFHPSRNCRFVHSPSFTILTTHQTRHGFLSWSHSSWLNPVIRADVWWSLWRGPRKLDNRIGTKDDVILPARCTWKRCVQLSRTQVGLDCHGIWWWWYVKKTRALVHGKYQGWKRRDWKVENHKRERVRFNEAMSRRKRNEIFHKEGKKRKRWRGSWGGRKRIWRRGQVNRLSWESKEKRVDMGHRTPDVILCWDRAVKYVLWDYWGIKCKEVRRLGLF